MRMQLEKWLKEISRFGNTNDFVEWCEGEGSPEKVREKVCIYTKDNYYAIVAIWKKNGKSYLGCVANKRKPRAGESWTRGNDLPDGDFSEKTWNEIKNAIIAYELVKIAKTVRELTDKELKVKKV